MISWLPLVHVALAAPIALPVQGVATTATGAPMDGERAVTFRLWPAEAGGPATWTQDVTVAFNNGAFSAILDGGSPLLSLEMFHDAGLWLSMQVLGEPETGRLRLGTAPYAASAQYAHQADAADTAARLGTLGPSDVITWDDDIPWDQIDLTGAVGNGLRVTPSGAIALDRDEVFDTDAELYAALDGRYLQQTAAASTYLSQAAAATTYLTITAASSTYLSQAAAASTYLPLAGGTVSGVLTLGAAPTAPGHAATKGYVDTSLTPYLTSALAASTYLTQTSAASAYLPLTGGTVSGNLTLGTAPTSAGHAATKGYVDTSLTPYATSASVASTYLTQASAASTYLPLAGGTVSGNLTLGTTPTSAGHAATKGYVDTSLTPYATSASVAATYLTQANAASTYLPSASAATTYLSQANAASTYLPRAGGTMTGTLVATTVDFGTGTSDDLVAADVTTLTGGGNADALHTHAGTVKPWVACGNMSDLIADCQVTNYHTNDFEYGFNYNTVEIHPAFCTQWNRGVRVYNRELYWVQADNPQSGTVGYGGASFYTGTDASDDDTCPTSSPRHQYWRLDANNNVIMLSGNGCFDHPVFCRRR